MLGWSPAQIEAVERARFANELFACPWTAPANRRHDGYARDAFRWLLARETPPPARPLSPWRELERLTWWLMRAFSLLQAQRQRLNASAA